jgi:hypothetical protein
VRVLLSWTHPNHFSTVMLMVWATDLPQWIIVIITFLTLTTIARPIYQAASEGCGCRYTETMGEFQNLRWLNRKGWNYIMAITSKWFSLVNDWGFLGIPLCSYLTSNLLSVQNGMLLFVCENIYNWSMMQTLYTLK